MEREDIITTLKKQILFSQLTDPFHDLVDDPARSGGASGNADRRNSGKPRRLDLLGRFHMMCPRLDFNADLG
jgi:hypothetical protein